ncbi:MAG: NUDIX domain-containing protein [Bifidobacteriaceae bacterium]|nr:NUDIX domain-containing protein [Bifidobacteriaceae bacterium]
MAASDKVGDQGRRDPADAWFDCACGQRHWGSRGAAGLLVWRGDRVLLQLRGPRSHHGGSWGLPGGARQTGEPPLAAALREGREETGLNPAGLRPAWWSIADHGGWSYTTIAAEAAADPALIDPAPAEAGAAKAGGAGAPAGPAPGGDRLIGGQPNWETSALAWVARERVADRQLHPGLAAAWPALEPLIGRRLTVVVDAANVVGSRPDGWWRDRAGAAARLRDRLEAVVAAGLANIWSEQPNGWWPELVMVVEGQARGIGQGESVRVVAAPGEGDDEIAAQARRAAAAGGGPVTVVTADKGLIGRLGAGVGVMRPGELLGLLDRAEGPGQERGE